MGGSYGAFVTSLGLRSNLISMTPGDRCASVGGGDEVGCLIERMVGLAGTRHWARRGLEGRVLIVDLDLLGSWAGSWHM